MTTSLDPAKLAAHIADREAKIAGQRALVERLQTLADDEYRELSRLESQLAAFREYVAVTEALAAGGGS